MLSLECSQHSVKWSFLYALLFKFGFGTLFMAWVKLFYSHPVAAIREAGRISPTFYLCCFRDKIKIWNKLWLSLTDKVNLVQMIFMPQLLFFLHNTSIVIPLSIFQEVNSIFRHLLWHNKIPRLGGWSSYKACWGSSHAQYYFVLLGCNTWQHNYNTYVRA